MFVHRSRYIEATLN